VWVEQTFLAGKARSGAAVWVDHPVLAGKAGNGVAVRVTGLAGLGWLRLARLIR